MKFLVDLSVALEAEDIGAAFKAAVAGTGSILSASIRPHWDAESFLDPIPVEAEPALPVEKHEPAPAEVEKPKAKAKAKPGPKKKAPAVKVVEPEPLAVNISKEQLVEVARQFMSKFGGAKTRELLKEFGAAQLREVEEAKWPEVFAKLQAALEGDE